MGETIKKLAIFLIFILILTTFVIAEPTPQYTKLYLDPLNRPSMTANTIYQYNLSVQAPDGITSITNAMINFEIYLSPTVNFNLNVNGQNCNPPTFSVSTTYMTSGLGRISYDCSNIINKAGQYNITLQPTKNTGTTTGWLELSYINNPKATIDVKGTEYIAGQPAKAWLQLLNSSNEDIENGVCFVDIYTPTNSEYIERAHMTNLEHDGIYYYDLIAPQQQGVYPIIATCYYEGTEYDFNATDYYVNTGTFSAGLITDTYTIDGNFLRLKETNTGGNRRIEAGLNFTNLTGCTNISELFLTDVVIETYMKFDSVANDNLNISVYNYTSNTWQQLPNKHLESNSFTTTGNTITTNNITKSGIYNETTGIQIRFQDDNITDGANSNLDIDLAQIKCEALFEPSWQQVKGSSEMHVTPPIGGYNFGVNSLCGNEDLSNACSVFFQDTLLLDEPQGLILENITINNLANIPVSDHIHYETGSTIDCSAIYSVEEHEINGTIIDLTNDTIYSAGNGLDNCVLQIPINLNFNETGHNIIIVMENYALWEIQRTNDLVGIFNQTISDFCYAENYTYVIPINQTLNKTGIDILCNRALDDLYWYDTLVRNEGTYATTMGEIEAYIIEERFYYPEILNAFSIVLAEIRNRNQQAHYNLSQDTYELLINLTLNLTADFNTTQDLINIQTQKILDELYNHTIILNQTTNTLTNLTNITTTNQNWLIQIWNYLTGWITTTLQEINQTTTNNSFKLDLLLNQSNITTQSINIATIDNTPCIAGDNWVINAIVTGYYGNLLTNTQANCTINNTLTGLNNMTYTETGLWEYQTTCPTDTTWNWSITCI